MLVRHAQVCRGLEVPDARGGEGILVEGVENMCKRFQGCSRRYSTALGPCLSIVKFLGIAVRVRHP